MCVHSDLHKRDHSGVLLNKEQFYWQHEVHPRGAAASFAVQDVSKYGVLVHHF